MIKVMNLVALILAPIVVQTSGTPSVGVTALIVIGIIAILWSVRRSDRDESAELEAQASQAPVLDAKAAD